MPCMDGLDKGVSSFIFDQLLNLFKLQCPPKMLIGSVRIVQLTVVVVPNFTIASESSYRLNDQLYLPSTP